MNRALGKVVASDLGESGQRDEIEQLGELGGLSWPKAECGEVVLVDACVAGEGNSRQKLLDRLVLLTVDRHLVGLGLLEAQIVLEPHCDGIIEGKLESFVAGWMSGNTAKKWIHRRCWIRRLRTCSASQASQNQYGQQSLDECKDEDRISRAIHKDHYFR